MIETHLRKQQTSQINNLTLHLKELEKEEQTKPKVSRRKEIINIKAEINEIETKEIITKINKTKSWFPGGPVVRILCSHCRGTGFDPWLGN